MSKNKQTEAEVDDVFANFNFLDGVAPAGTKKVDKLETQLEVEDDNLSEAELAALEAASKSNKQAKPKENTKEDLAETAEEQEVDDEKRGDINPISEFAKWLNEESILDLEAEDKVESEDDLKRVTINTIKNGVNKYKESIPEDGKKFLEFIENGGKASDFHKYYYGESSFEDFDISSVENQKYVIAESLKLEGYTDDEIKEEIELLEDTERLEKKSTTHLNKLKKVEKEQKATLLEIQKNYAKEEEAKRLKEWEGFQKGLFDKEAIGGFKLTPKVKENLWAYMTKVVDKKAGLTQYQIDANSSDDSKYMAAYLQMNKWDTSSLERLVESKKTSELKSKLGNFTDTRNKQKGAASKIVKDDVNTDPFEAFSKVFNK